MIISTKNSAGDRLRRRELRIRQLEQDRDEREGLVFDRVPRLAEIKGIQSEIGLDLSRLMLRVATFYGKDFEELKSWSLALSAERNQLLAQHRINPSDLEVSWDCVACKNTGWLPPEPAGPDTVHPAEKCSCLIQEEIDDLYRSAGLTGPLREQTFEGFDLSVYPPQDQEYMSKLMTYCREYASDVAQGKSQESLLLTGDVGRGKTFLASAIGNVVVAQKQNVVYFTLSEFMALLRMVRLDDDMEYRAGVQRLLEATLIILDDLGAEKVTEFVAQELFNIINHRMNRSLPMVVSTNLTPDQIEADYGARIASRLLNGFEGLHLVGDDIRRVRRRRS
jgi:DNA replication protein DnaC